MDKLSYSDLSIQQTFFFFFFFENEQNVPITLRKTNQQYLFGNDKIQVFKQKLEIWKRYIYQSELDNFSILL